MASAFVNATAGGNTQLIAGVVGKRIRVLSYTLSFGGTVGAQFQSANTPISCLFSGIAGTQVAPGSLEAVYGHQRGHFSTNPGEDLNINLSGAGVVGVQVETDVLGV